VTTAIVGRTGSGKTFAAKGMVEGFLAAGERVCIVDPTGAWWGLRARGAGPALEVIIIGGEHADVPLLADGGERLADLVASGAVPQAVIDISEMTGGEQTRLLTAFFEQLYARNRGPLHLVLDEADVMAPQNPMPDQRRLQGAVNKIVRRGRIKGFRPIMITQRPAVLDKSVLSQIDTLVAMRLTSPQDRKAIEAWVKGSADEEQARPVLASLASLPRGEGWFWAPADGVLERRAFPAIQTYDSSRTPEIGEEVAAVVSAPAGLDEIRKALAPPAEEPSAAKAAPAAPASSAELNAAEQRGYERGFFEGRTFAANAIADPLKALRLVLAQAPDAIEAMVAEMLRPEPVSVVTGEEKTRPVGGHPPPPRPPRVERPRPSGSGTEGLTKPQMRVMASLGFWTSIGFEDALREQVAFAAGYTPGSGNFNNLLGSLKARGDISYPQPGRVRIENAALMIDMTKAEAATALRRVLSAPQLKLVDALLALPEVPVSRAQLAARTDYAAGSGNFNNLVGSLRSISLISYPASGMVALEDWVRRVL
jgi:hypothetical protein